MDGQVIEGASSHTTGHMSGRVQVIAQVSGRRIFTVEQQLAIMRDAFGPGRSVRAACERHEVSNGQVYTWRRNAMSGQMGLVRPAAPVFAEVEVADPPLLPPPVVEGAGRIGIELPSGIKLSVDASVGWRGAGARAVRPCPVTGAAAIPAFCAPHARVFLACGATDMRKGFDGLAVRAAATAGQPAFGRDLRVPGQARRSGQAALV